MNVRPVHVVNANHDMHSPPRRVLPARRGAPPAQSPTVSHTRCSKPSSVLPLPGRPHSPTPGPPSPARCSPCPVAQAHPQRAQGGHSEVNPWSGALSRPCLWPHHPPRGPEQHPDQGPRGSKPPRLALKLSGSWCQYIPWACVGYNCFLTRGFLCLLPSPPPCGVPTCASKTPRPRHPHPQQSCKSPTARLWLVLSRNKGAKLQV